MSKLKKLLSLIIVVYSIIAVGTAFGAEDMVFSGAMYKELLNGSEYGIATSFGWIKTNNATIKRMNKEWEKDMSEYQRGVWDAINPDYGVEFAINKDRNTQNPKYLTITFNEGKTKLKTFKHFLYDTKNEKVYTLPYNYGRSRFVKPKDWDSDDRKSITGSITFNEYSYSVLNDLIYVFEINGIYRRLYIEDYNFIPYIQASFGLVSNNQKIAQNSFIAANEKYIEEEKASLIRMVNNYHAYAKRAVDIGFKGDIYKQSWKWIYRYVTQNPFVNGADYFLDSTGKHIITVNSAGFTSKVNGYQVYGGAYYYYIIVNGQVIYPKKNENGAFTHYFIINGKEYKMVDERL